MLRFITSHKLFFSAVFLCLLTITGSLIYYAHVTRTVDTELGATEQFPKHPETDEPTESSHAPETEGVEGTAQSNSDMHLVDAPENGAEPTEMETMPVGDSASGEAVASSEDTPENVDISVSPYGYSLHGFGPYPVIPADYPMEMAPTWTKYDRPAREHELIDRVLIKLWNQGDREVSGGFSVNGLVYPLYPNAVYVKWEEREMLDGTVRRFIGGITGTGDVKPIMRDGVPVLPEGIRTMDEETSGINPYEFLDLR